jgi:hypothetical protein
MTKAPGRTQTCHVCGKPFPLRTLKPWATIRTGVSEVIEAAHPGWGDGAFICEADLAEARRDYVEALLEEERGELSALDRDVVEALSSHQFCHPEYGRRGQRAYEHGRPGGGPGGFLWR